MRHSVFPKALLFFLACVIASGSIVQTGQASPSKMVEIPGGPFVSASPSKSFSDKQPPVHLETFFIDTHEVTNEEFMEKFPNHTFWPGAESHPVSNISWHEAEQYCVLSGKRLPSEMEWEKSAGGPKSRVYPWGDELPKKKPHPYFSGIIKRRVGLNRKDVSFYGVRDLAGSVWEWVADRVDGKSVVRGGLWNLHLDYEYSKTYERNLIHPDRRFIFLGFRCARSK